MLFNWILGVEESMKWLIDGKNFEGLMHRLCLCPNEDFIVALIDRIVLSSEMNRFRWCPHVFNLYDGGKGKEKVLLYLIKLIDIRTIFAADTFNKHYVWLNNKEDHVNLLIKACKDRRFNIIDCVIRNNLKYRNYFLNVVLIVGCELGIIDVILLVRKWEEEEDSDVNWVSACLIAFNVCVLSLVYSFCVIDWCIVYKAHSNSDDDRNDELWYERLCDKIVFLMSLPDANAEFALEIEGNKLKNDLINDEFGRLRIIGLLEDLGYGGRDGTKNGMMNRMRLSSFVCEGAVVRRLSVLECSRDKLKNDLINDEFDRSRIIGLSEDLGCGGRDETKNEMMNKMRLLSFVNKGAVDRRLSVRKYGRDTIVREFNWGFRGKVRRATTRRKKYFTK